MTPFSPARRRPAHHRSIAMNRENAEKDLTQRARNANARSGAAPSDANDAGKTGISTDGKGAGEYEGCTGYARASAEDCRRIESHIGASGGGDARRQGTPATIGPLSESDSGLHRR